MFPYVYILGYEIELYNIFNFLAVCAVVFLGVHWNYKYGPKYTIGLDILFLMAPLAFLLGRIFFYIFLACPGSKMQFFNPERGGSMFLGAFTGGLFGALLYFELKEFHYFKDGDISLTFRLEEFLEGWVAFVKVAVMERCRIIPYLLCDFRKEVLRG
jgi:prolipoprotein diacylglyceryltransferase